MNQAIEPMPAVLLIRAGSQRLKEKWRLHWRGVMLPEYAIRQALAAKYVSRVIVASDSQELLDIVGRRFGEGTREAFSRNERGRPRVTCTLRPKVPGDQPSLDGLRWVLRHHGLQASYCLLVQATFPFLEAGDLDRLVEVWHANGAGRGIFLARPDDDTKPAGAAWIVDPYNGYYSSQSPVAVSTPCVDIDVKADYEKALEIERGQL